MDAKRQPGQAPSTVIVVGAGIGGLVAALELAHAGMAVTVLERAPQSGGKLRELVVAGAAIDAGPTVFTMRWVFEELFARLGERLDAHLSLEPAEVLARHAWSDGARLDLYADLERSVAAIDAFAGAEDGERYRRFCVRTQRIAQTLEAPFLRGTRPNPLSLAWRAGWRGLPGLLDIAPFSTMWRELGRHFKDPRLCQLFGRYATYCGSSPFSAPATLMLVAHVERQGVWLVQGGMRRIAQALQALAEARGVCFQFGCGVHEVLVQGGRAAGVQLDDGREMRSAQVVFNGDVAALAGGQLGAGVSRAVPAVRPWQRSLSALTWNLRVPATGFPLSRHNVFFSDDYRAEFDDLRLHGRLPQQPTVYVCAPDRSARAEDPERGGNPAQRLLVLVNAPPLGDQGRPTDEEITRCQTQTFAQLLRCGLNITPDPAACQRTTPSDFARLFPATGGALYGAASHGWQASFTRPGSRCKLPGLYLAGGSTHPGPGVPMAALSGHQAALALLADQPRRDLTSRLTPAATPGGTSTPSATTAARH